MTHERMSIYVRGSSFVMQDPKTGVRRTLRVLDIKPDATIVVEQIDGPPIESEELTT